MFGDRSRSRRPDLAGLRPPGGWRAGGQTSSVILISSLDRKGVEWTSSGYNLLKDADITFPVINMGHSKAKQTLEAPPIAEEETLHFRGES